MSKNIHLEFEDNLLDIAKRGYIRADAITLLNKRLEEGIDSSSNVKTILSLLEKGIQNDNKEYLARAFDLFEKDGTHWRSLELRNYIYYTVMYFNEDLERGVKELKKNKDQFSQEALGFYLSEQGNTSESIRVFKQVISNFKNHGLASWGLSEELQRNQEYDEALSVSKNACSKFEETKYLHICSLLDIYSEIGISKEGIMWIYKILLEEQDQKYRYFEAVASFLRKYFDVVPEHIHLHDKILKLEDELSNEAFRDLAYYRMYTAKTDEMKKDIITKMQSSANSSEKKHELLKIEYDFLTSSKGNEDFKLKVQQNLSNEKEVTELHFLNLKIVKNTEHGKYLETLDFYINNIKISKTPAQARRLYLLKFDYLLEAGNYRIAHEIIFNEAIIPKAKRANYYNRYVTLLKRLGSKNALVNVSEEILSDNISKSRRGRINWELYKVFKKSIEKKQSRKFFKNALDELEDEYRLRPESASLEYSLAVLHAEEGNNLKKIHYLDKIKKKYIEGVVDEDLVLSSMVLLNTHDVAFFKEVMSHLEMDTQSFEDLVSVESIKRSLFHLSLTEFQDSIFMLIEKDYSEENVIAGYKAILNSDIFSVAEVYELVQKVCGKLSGTSSYQKIVLLAFENISSSNSVGLLRILKNDSYLAQKIDFNEPNLKLVEIRKLYDEGSYQECLDEINNLIDDELKVADNIIDQARYIKFSIELKLNYSVALVGEILGELEVSLSEKLRIELHLLIIQNLVIKKDYNNSLEQLTRLNCYLETLRPQDESMFLVKYLTANCLYKLEKFELALEVLDEIPVLDTEWKNALNESEVYDLKSRLYFKTNNLNKSKRMMENAIKCGVRDSSFILEIDEKISTLFKNFHHDGYANESELENTSKEDKALAEGNFFKQIDFLTSRSNSDICPEFKSKFKNIEITCHYTTSETALFYILPGQFSHNQETERISLRFSPLKIVNDIQEGNFYLNTDLTQDSVKVKIFKKFQMLTRSHVKIFCTSWNNIPPQLMDHTNSPLTIPPMWSRYSSNFSGCAIIFNKNGLEESLRAQVQESKFHALKSRRVIYSYVRSQKKLDIKISNSDLENILSNNYSSLKFFENSSNLEKLNLFYFKPPQWDYEKEYRFGLIDESSDSPVNIMVPASNILGIVIGIDMLKGYRELFKQKCKMFGWELYVYDPNSECKIYLLKD